MGLDHSRAEFESTHWSLIDQLREGDSGTRDRALARLALVYWPPVYGYLRRQGLGREGAEETTQAFFADVVLQRRLFDAASPQCGRLRSLLLVALKRFCIDQSRRRRARGSAVTMRLDAARIDRQERALERDGVARADPDAEFERQWAATLVEEAVRRCREHFETSGRSRHWSVFEERILGPSVGFTVPPPLAEAAARHGWTNSADAAAAVQVVKKRFEAIFREVVSETVSDDANDEYRRVMRQLT